MEHLSEKLNLGSTSLATTYKTYKIEGEVQSIL